MRTLRFLALATCLLLLALFQSGCASMFNYAANGSTATIPIRAVDAAYENAHVSAKSPDGFSYEANLPCEMKLPRSLRRLDLTFTHPGYLPDHLELDEQMTFAGKAGYAGNAILTIFPFPLFGAGLNVGDVSRTGGSIMKDTNIFVRLTRDPNYQARTPSTPPNGLIIPNQSLVQSPGQADFFRGANVGQPAARQTTPPPDPNTRQLPSWEFGDH